VSAYVTSPETTVAAQEPDQKPPPPTTTEPARLRPRLKITRVKRRGSRLIVRGTVARGASGRIKAVFTVRGRRAVARAAVDLHRPEFTLVLKVRATRRGRLAVTYLGDGRFASQARHLSIRAG
jgi:hypothetical protein